MIRTYSLSRVKITDAVLDNAYRKEEYIRSIEPDRLLAKFKEAAGMEKKAEAYTEGFSCYMTGYYMTAAAQLYQATGAKDLKDRLEYMLEELTACQSYDGYLFSGGRELFDNIEQGSSSLSPWFSLYKVLEGLLNVYTLTGFSQALQLAEQLGNWVYWRVKNWKEEVRARVLAMEYGGMNDCLYELYKLTGKAEYLVAAGQFDELELYQEIADGRDVLNEKKVGATILKFLGAVNRYLVLGKTETFYLKAAVSFFEIVTQNHAYVTGGIGENSLFGLPDILGAERSEVNCETCSSYCMLRLAKRLFLATQEKRYMEFYERLYYNAILGAQNPENGMTAQFQPMQTGYAKVFCKPYEEFTCCTGTGMECFTNLGDMIYMQDGQNVYVNLFVTSSLLNVQSGIQLHQQVEWNRMNRISLVIEADKSADFTICVRVPEWTNRHFSVSVNEKETDYVMRRGYVCVEREWQDGDKLHLQLYPQVQLKTLPDEPEVAAFTYGPFVLCAAFMGEHASVKESITLLGSSVSEWFDRISYQLVKREQEMVFDLHGTCEDGLLHFIPYYKQYKDKYGVYWKFNSIDVSEPMPANASGRTAKQEKQKKTWKMSKRAKIATACLVPLVLLCGAGFVFRDSIKTVLSERFSFVANWFQSEEEENNATVVPSVTPVLREVYEENLGQKINATVFPDGYTADVVTVEGLEYLMLKKEDLSVCYQNEKTADGKKTVLVSNGRKTATFYWNYDFTDLAVLCPQIGAFNGFARQQAVFLHPNGNGQELHILNISSLTEYYIEEFETALQEVLTVNSYVPAEQGIMLETTVKEIPYTFALPADETASIVQYAVSVGEEIYFEPADGEIGFTSYAKAGDWYLGEMRGALRFNGTAYALDRVTFYAYAEDNYGDMDASKLLYPIEKAELSERRIITYGDAGENLLVGIKETLPQNVYPADAFVKTDGEYTYVEKGVVTSKKGVDVSKYQGEIDWKKVAADGVEFAMIRLGFRGMGTNGTCELDPYYEQNIRGALAAGLEVGVYFFTQATTVEEAVEEAEFVLEHLKGYPITYPVAYDTESIPSYPAARANKLAKSVRTDCVAAFMETIADAGYQPMLYANTGWLIMKLDLERLSEYDLWYAYYGDNLYYPYHFTMWQYTSSGKVNGITGNVDMNIHIVK